MKLQAFCLRCFLLVFSIYHLWRCHLYLVNRDFQLSWKSLTKLQIWLLPESIAVYSHHVYYLIGLLLYNGALLTDKHIGYAKSQTNIEWLHNIWLKEHVVFNMRQHTARHWGAWEAVRGVIAGKAVVLAQTSFARAQWLSLLSFNSAVPISPNYGSAPEHAIYCFPYTV